jgi:hypothetical protein
MGRGRLLAVGHARGGLVPQVSVSYEGAVYRLDFELADIQNEGPPSPRWRIAIEVDGHDYHERTKEQARRDRSRDRVLQAAGYVVMRFTGSELWANPMKCADEVFAMAHGLEVKVREAEGR